MTRSFWTLEQLNTLRSIAGTTSLPKLGKLFGKTGNAVRRACQRHGIPYMVLKKQHARREWEPSEQRWLAMNSANYTVLEMCKILRVGKHPLRSFLARHNLPFKNIRRNWEKNETLKLMTYSEVGNAEYIAKKLGRPVPTVSTRIRKLGVRSYSGAHTLVGMAKDTGYHYTQIEAARDALGQVWRRTSKRFVITEAQYEELMQYFRNGGVHDQGEAQRAVKSIAS